RAVPRLDTRRMLEVGRQALDGVWARDGYGPALGAIVVEHDGERVARVGPAAEVLADMHRIAPGVARYAAAGERMRALASADAWIVAVPDVGPPAVVACGRPGRFLADEDLEELALIAARDDASVCPGGDA